MDYKDQIDFITKHLVYRGRAMAFYKDGRDYGVVTVVSAKDSHYLITTSSCFIYSETSHELIGICRAGGHAYQKIFEPQVASCGRKYILECDTCEDEEIYIGEFF